MEERFICKEGASLHSWGLVADEGPDGADASHRKATVVLVSRVAHQLAGLKRPGESCAEVGDLVGQGRLVGDYVVTSVVLEGDRHLDERAAFFRRCSNLEMCLDVHDQVRLVTRWVSGSQKSYSMCPVELSCFLY